MAFYGRIKSRLLKQTGSRSIIHYFPDFFRDSTDSSSPILSTDFLYLGQLYKDMVNSYSDITMIYAPSSDGELNINNYTFLSDSTFTMALLGCLQILDNNTNSVPGETVDALDLKKDFSIFYSNLSAAQGTNALYALAMATNYLAVCTNYLSQLFTAVPGIDTADTAFYHLMRNMQKTISNCRSSYTNIEAGL